MIFKIFKNTGEDIIINIDNIISIKTDETSGKTIIYSISQSNEVDESLEEIEGIFGVGSKKEVRGF
jgi:hypothetical protein